MLGQHIASTQKYTQLDLFYFASKILQKILPQFLKSTNEDHQVHFDDIGFSEVDLVLSNNIKNTMVWICEYNNVGPGGIVSNMSEYRRGHGVLPRLFSDYFFLENQKGRLSIFLSISYVLT